VSNPHNFSSGTQKALFRLALGHCYFPECVKPIMEDVAGKPVVGVQIAHIRGAEPSAPRYDPAMTDEERASFPNLILLCQAHHTTIDRVSPDDYPVAMLEEWKQENEPNGGVEVLRGLTESTLETLIEAAVMKAGRTREVKVELSCGVETAPKGWTLLPFELLSKNPALDVFPKEFCITVANTGPTDVSVNGFHVLSEHEGVDGNPRYVPDVRFSEMYPQLPFRLLSGDSKTWFLPFEALEIMRNGLVTKAPPIAGVFVVVLLATGEQAESLPVVWSEIEPLLSTTSNSSRR
jgi:hypothetical protein